MKKILLTASTTALLCGCGGPNYSITGNAGLEPGDSVFLIGSGRTELAAGVVCADSTIRLQGRVAEPEIARLANQERIPVGTAVIFLEPGDIRTVPTDDRRVYAVSGTPLNDKNASSTNEWPTSTANSANFPLTHRPTRSMRHIPSWFRKASEPIRTTFSGHTSSPSTNSTATTSPQPRPVWNASHPPCRRIRR